MFPEHYSEVLAAGQKLLAAASPLGVLMTGWVVTSPWQAQWCLLRSSLWLCVAPWDKVLVAPPETVWMGRRFQGMDRQGEVAQAETTKQTCGGMVPFSVTAALY